MTRPRHPSKPLTPLGVSLQALERELGFETYRATAQAIGLSHSLLWGIAKRNWDFHQPERQELLMWTVRALRSRLLQRTIEEAVSKSTREDINVIATVMAAWEEEPFLPAIYKSAAQIPAINTLFRPPRPVWLGASDQARPYDVRDVSPRQIRRDCISMRPLMMAGRSTAVLMQCVDELLAVQHSGWADSAEGLELQACLYLEFVFAFQEAFSVHEYRAMFSAVDEALRLAYQLRRRFAKGKQAQSIMQNADALTARGDLMVGMAERKISEELSLAQKFGDRTDRARLEQLHKECLATASEPGTVHPLVLALKTPDLEDRLWTFTELIKRFPASDWEAVLKYAAQAQALIDGNSRHTSEIWYHLLSVFPEALARAYEQHGDHANAADLIAQARNHAVTDLNIFEADTTLGIIHWGAGARDEAQHRLSDLARNPIGPFQGRKIGRMTKERGIVLVA